ncbi:hypothetical protein EDC14_101347 [Hydrogenispora ethanolica]|uniref:Uncharacterized protein n=1 Tax=Hydrogenispora ethanolica TaxID=1082276 RepID=A0A4V2QEM2_HYDET|nr:hypothetical protein [Hydrogenispora ethanolica]TCL68507.1 hypothetical protein EDC14_101347 [Hydrogenispora ethanolica]
MNDKYLHGLLAGLAGGVAAIAVNLLVILILKAHILRYIDFAGVLSFGRMPRGFWETCFALIVYTGFAGTLGVIFSYLLPHLGTACLSLKGMHYGSFVWFSSYAITTLYKTPHLVTISLESAASNFCAAIVYGLVMSLVLGWFLARRRNSPQPLK